MNNKILYINFDYKDYTKKTNAQIASFKRYNLIPYLLILTDSELILYDCSNEEKKKINSIFIKNKIKIFKFLEIFRKIKFADLQQYKYVYIRRIGLPIIFCNIKKIFSQNILIYEIPTFPFDKSASKKHNFIQFIEYKSLDKFVFKKFDCIPANIQSDSKKMPKNMIKIFNGIDINSYDIKKRKIRKREENELKLVGIAHLNYWHGYDRIIKSIEKSDKNITFTIYTNKTAEYFKLKNYVKKHNLTSKVFFVVDNGKIDFQNEINNFDVAVGGIGFYRRNAKYDTSIKNKEYCALGIPFIISIKDESFGKNFKYLYKVSENDSLINFNDVISWYSKIEKSNFINEMFNYASSNLTYDYSINKILTFIKDGE